MPKCLVTGATGLIGSNLIPALLPHWEVVGISRGRPANQWNQGDSYCLALDFSRPWDTSALPRSMDAVIHLAQSEHFRDFPERAIEVFSVNTASTLQLLDYARRAGAQTFILASSGGIYGHRGKELTEDMEISAKGDLGFYLGTKLCAELIAENYISYLHVIVLRFFFIYGSGQRKSMLIPRLVQSILEGKPILLQGEEGVRINPTYVSDAVAAITRALHLKGNHKINVAGPEILSLRQVGEIIGKAAGREPEFQIQAEAEPWHVIGDIRKMSELLGPPTVRFEQGIRVYLHV